jgi:AcrR family transcriptional regulator
VTTKAISEETRKKILEAAWALFAERGEVGVSQVEIAQATGVSRQTLFLAFGDRAGLLRAMLQHKDTLSDHAQRLGFAGGLPPSDPESLLASVQAWLDYLPIIYPVGILLDAAALTDPAARAAWDDRMKGALLAGWRARAKAAHAAGNLQGNPDRVAEEIWALCHPSAWRLLVAECGWSADEFRQSRIDLVRACLNRG